MADPLGNIGPMARGTFQVTISGDVEAVLRGNAVFGVTANEQGKDIFALVLKPDVDELGRHLVMLTNALRQAPEAGRYQFGEMGPRSFVGLYSLDTDEGKTGSYAADRGTLDIVDSGPVHVQGAFEFTATGTNNFELFAVEGDVRAFGLFDALRVADPFAYAFE
jgi:hypothetical protein